LPFAISITPFTHYAIEPLSHYLATPRRNGDWQIVNVKWKWQMANGKWDMANEM
jgi:hypothetical protein